MPHLKKKNFIRRRLGCENGHVAKSHIPDSFGIGESGEDMKDEFFLLAA
jgi:hypothetical protein